MHTNNTAHYNLPQFIGSDIPNPLTDWNDSMQDIDTAMYEIKTQADEIGSDIVEDEADISDLQSQANLTDDNITLLNQQTTAARSAATDAQDAANRNAANITTLQQSVANNRTSITQYNNRFNQNVPFAFGIEEVEDPDNPGQTVEQYGFYTVDDPSEFVPFGEATNVDPDTSIIVAVTGERTGSVSLNDVQKNSLVILSFGANSNNPTATALNLSNLVNCDIIYNTNSSVRNISVAVTYSCLIVLKAKSNAISFDFNSNVTGGYNNITNGVLLYRKA